MADSEGVKRAGVVREIAQNKFRLLLRKDEQVKAPIHTVIPAVSFEASAQFFSYLDNVLKENTPRNIQTCKEWVMKNVAPSKARIAVLGDYLVAVSRALVVDHKCKSPKAARDRLSIVFLVSDALHTDKFHHHNGPGEGVFTRELMPKMEQLVELAASAATCKEEKKLKDVVVFWANNGCISAEQFKALRERVEIGLITARGGTPPRKRTYALPDTFGDRSTPWYDLPASYMLEPMIRHPDRAIDRSEISIRSFSQRQASEHVRNLLDELFENIDLKYDPTNQNPLGGTEKYKLWLDPMGQLVKQNKETGEAKTVCNGYGWSTRFCKDMLEYKIPDAIHVAREEYQHPKMQQEAVARSRSPKRRRSSSVSDMDRDRSYSRSRSRSSYGSRPGTRDGDRSFNNHRWSKRDESESDDESRSWRDRVAAYEKLRKASRGSPLGPSNPLQALSYQRILHGENNRSNYGGPGAHNYNQDRNYPPQPPQPPTQNNTPAYPLLSNPMRQQNMHGFQAYPTSFQPPPPPPPPPPVQGGMIFPTPPPPPIFNGQFPNPPPPMTGYPNNTYNNFGNNNGPAYGNNGGYGGPQHQGGFQGGFGSGYQGRGGYIRGGHRGGRGGGSRWN